jgi:FixJ family two-component response regulator
MSEPINYVAIVDDDASVRKALARLVAVFSYRVRTFASVREFLESLKDDVPACLIVDLQMEETTGLELQQHLQSTGSQIPTIVLTAHDEPGMQDRCTDAGAVAFLVKPVAKDQLLEAIEAATSRGPGGRASA